MYLPRIDNTSKIKKEVPELIVGDSYRLVSSRMHAKSCCEENKVTYLDPVPLHCFCRPKPPPEGNGANLMFYLYFLCDSCLVLIS